MKEYRSAALTMTGRRTRNQDNFLLNGQMLEAKHGNDNASASGVLEGPLLFVAVDGAGTNTTGETASRIVCERLWAVHEQFEEMNELSEAATVINAALCEVNKDIEAVMMDEPKSKMGATAALLLIYNGKAIFGNVGDSAVYLKRDGKVKKLTRDHTEGEELIARGALTEDMLKVHSSKNKLTRSIGAMTFGREDIMQFYDIIDVHDGDIFVIASQGVVRYMTPDAINTGLHTGIDLAKCADRIVKAAIEQYGSKDNATALIVKVTEQVDSIGAANSKLKPIRAKGVHVKTSIDIDPKTLKVLAYIAVVIAILCISVVSLVKSYPRDKVLTHVEQSGAAWGDPNDISSGEEVKETPKPVKTEKPEDIKKSDDSDETKSSDTKKSDNAGADKKSDDAIEKKSDDAVKSGD